MKRLLVLMLLCTLCPALLQGQTRRHPASKRATKVDSVSAPPRMDGNTGKYDTLKQPRKNLRQSRKAGATYHYKIGVDTISKSAAPRNR